MTRKFIILAAMAWSLAAGAQSMIDAQRDSVIATHKVIHFGGGEASADSVRGLIEEF